MLVEYRHLGHVQFRRHLGFDEVNSSRSPQPVAPVPPDEREVPRQRMSLKKPETMEWGGGVKLR